MIARCSCDTRGETFVDAVVQELERQRKREVEDARSRLRQQQLERASSAFDQMLTREVPVLTAIRVNGACWLSSQIVDDLLSLCR